MAKSSDTGILRQHLENLAGDAFELYPHVVRELIRGHAGVYALYRDDRLYYVGLAVNLMARVKQHLRDHHQKRWNRFSVYLVENNKHMRELESLLLRIARPPGNRVVGRLGTSGDLRAVFSKRAQAVDSLQLTQLLGKSNALLWSKGPKAEIAKGAKKAKAGTKGKERSSATAGKVFVVLRRSYGGKEYKAFLRSNGTVKLGNKQYPSPSGAARAVVGRAVNGWSFWKCRDESGAWVPLDNQRTPRSPRAK